MDNVQNSDTYRMEAPLVLHNDEKEAVRNPDDALVRRLKNRERQRRYRARKRQEADLRKASIVGQSTPLPHQHMPTELLSVPVQADMSVNLSSDDCLARVHCRRDWKKDARRAHIQKKPEIRSNGHSNPETATPGVSPAPSTDSNATQRLQSNRRNWKAEARNKINSE